jgi:hypothetical protein
MIIAPLFERRGKLGKKIVFHVRCPPSNPRLILFLDGKQFFDLGSAHQIDSYEQFERNRKDKAAKNPFILRPRLLG